MSEILEKINQLRFENELNHCNPYEQEVFNQLEYLINTNKSNPGKLPKVFLIDDVILYKNHFEYLMKQIGIDAVVEKVGYSYLRGNNYKVTLKDS